VEQTGTRLIPSPNITYAKSHFYVLCHDGEASSEYNMLIGTELPYSATKSKLHLKKLTCFLGKTVDL
jgi:hypothetical protein